MKAKKLLTISRKSKQEEKEEEIEKSQYRLEVLKKIEQLEKEGKFDVDAEDDPPTIVLTPENIDYLRKKMTSKLKRVFANEVGERFLDNLLKNNKLIIKEINGIENLSKVSTGAIVTCNHFNPFDCFTIEKVFRMSGKIEEKRLYKVIREGNYTNFPGLYGFFFRNCDTLPLSSNKRTMVEFMKAVDTLLQKGDFILIYPEQSMYEALFVNPMESTSVLGMIYKQTAAIKDAQVLAFAPPMISGFSMQNGITMTMQDKTGGDLNKFFGNVKKFLAELNKRPEIQTAQTQYNPNYPQYMVDVDVAKSKQAGISPSTVLSVMQGYLGGLYASNFNAYGKLYRVMIQKRRTETTVADLDSRVLQLPK